MSNAKNFDVDLREEMSRLYDGLAVDQREAKRPALAGPFERRLGLGAAACGW
jgi:hypothetical protein